MNEIQHIEASVKQHYPKAVLKMDLPKHADMGVWFLDITNGEKRVVVTWQKAHGFGISLDGEKGTKEEIGYGEGPQHSRETKEDALFLIFLLLNT